MEERLQKLISSCGIASRRTAEEWIRSGRVLINGEKAELGDKADLNRDVVTVDGKPLKMRSGRLYLMLYKPRGYVSTLSDERGRRTVAHLVSGCGGRVWPVGRLDFDSEGLIIMTDDGALTQRLLHPSMEVEKEYLVWVTGDAERAIPVLSSPMELDGYQLASAQVRLGGVDGEVSRLYITIHQGKNRQVRRMCTKAGLKVQRLMRVREGGLLLDKNLKPGQWRYLTAQELQRLTFGR